MAFADIRALLPAALRARIDPLLGGGSRNIALAGAALVAAVAIVAVLWSWTSYAVLYAGLSPRQGGRAIAVLQKLNIPYRTAESGREILVPSSDLGRARLELAVRGVPRRGGDQWAQLDNESIGVSPFVEQVHYNRAMEGTLSRTIGQVDGVASASVRLALPKDTDFLGDEPKPSASVMVRLVPGTELTPAQVDGIAGLVAASVPGLDRDRVTIVDQTGKVLSQNGRSGLQQVPQQLGVVREIEGRYQSAIRDLLTPILGRGNFRVSVDADVDFSRAKESWIRYGSGHVLSQDETIHPAGTAGAAPIGIPGALSNRPPQAPTVQPNPPASSATASNATGSNAPGGKKPATAAPLADTHRTTNYDLDHTIEYLEHPPWTLRAIDVAVLIDHPPGKPLPAATIASIRTLVSSAVGAGDNRHIAVVDLPFTGLPEGGPLAQVAWWTNPWVAALAQNAMLALGGLLLLFGGLLPLRRWLDASHLAVSQEGSLVPAAVGAAGLPRTEPRIAAQGPRVVAGTAYHPGSLDADPETVRNLVFSEPDRTAQVIKEWIARDRTRLRQAG
jgi:flagellar M-ring protein FliF